MRPQARTLLGTAILLAATGCAGPSSDEDVLDLTAAFPFAEVRTEVSRIDFGTDDARPFLGSGFSWDEKSSDGTTFVWGVGDASQVRIFAGESRDYTATLRLSSYGRPRPVDVEAGGRTVAQLRLRPEMGTYEVSLPLTAGDNLVTFRYPAGPATTEQHGSRRRLSAAFDEMRLDLVEPGEVRTGEENGGRQLYLPYGAEVAFYVDAPGPARLTASAVRHRGDGRLEVTWRDDESGDHVAVLDEGPIAIPAPGKRPFRPLRVVLRAVGTRRADGGWQGIVVERPELRVARRAPLAATASGPAETVPPGTNVLLYLVDTLRADRLGVYGQSRPLTPRLDAFAADAVVFERMVAQASLTRPATASLMTGLGPLRHGVNSPESALPEAAVTLAELFEQAGYRTAAFSTNVNVTGKTGFGQGFDHFDFSYDGAADLNDRVLAWIDETEQPFFLYVHTIDPHEPYTPRAELRERFAPGAVPGVAGMEGQGPRNKPLPPEILASFKDLYDAEVAQNDAAFGALWDALAERGLPDRTLTLFLADHGEQFQEHGVIGHGLDLHREVLHVPFLLRRPGGSSPMRVQEAVQQIDLLPTLADLFGFERPPGVQGRSLLPLLSGRALPPSPMVSYIDYEGRRGFSVERDGWKLIQPLSAKFGKEPSLYAPSEDPAELHDRWSERPVLAGYLRTLGRMEASHLGRGLEAVPAEIDEETRRDLQALGYLHQAR